MSQKICITIIKKHSLQHPKIYTATSKIYITTYKNIYYNIRKICIAISKK